MPDPQSGIKIYTLAEANAALPRVRALLFRLRELRKQIVAKQALVDIEEMTGYGASKAAKIEEGLHEIEADVHRFHDVTEEFNMIGCELKDLEKGLVDFYGMRDNEVIYLCWMDGEAGITHWHTLDSGFQGRQEL